MSVTHPSTSQDILYNLRNLEIPGLWSCFSYTKNRFFLSAWPIVLTNFSFLFRSMLVISLSFELIILFYVTILVLIIVSIIVSCISQ